MIGIAGRSIRGLIAALAFAAGMSADVLAQAYPNKPIRMIVPYPPGGGLTPTARLIGQKLTESWGQQVLVDNRAGANTVIGTEAVAKAAPDGYTLLFQANSHLLTPLLLPTPYDAVRDFSPIATLTVSEFGLVVHPSVRAGNLQELIALAKAQPGQLNYATPGSGNVTHMAIELVILMAGIKMQQVPYKGSGPAMTDLLGGQVQVYMGVSANVIPHVRTGKLTGIAVSGERRLRSLPQVPTLAEAGLPAFKLNAWSGIFSPAGTPKAIVDKLAMEINKAVATVDFKEKIAEQALDPFISTTEQFAALIKSDTANFVNVIKNANIKLEQ